MASDPESNPWVTHVTRLCACLAEAVEFAEAISPGTGHNAGMWAAAICEAREALEADQGGQHER